MRFEFYHDGLANVPKISVDGIVAEAVHLSHWRGNQTPREVKADTSTEIALNVVASPLRESITRGIDLVTNNHFDTDGVLSVWTMLNGARANEHRDVLIAAAEAGDFSEFSSTDGIRVSIAIQGSDNPIGDPRSISPLATHLAGEAVTEEASAYRLVLPEVENLLTGIGDYEHLWRDGWTRIERAIESFERGDSTVVEFEQSGISFVSISPDVFASTAFDRRGHGTPFTAISRYARGRLFVIGMKTDEGWSYRIDYPYYSWAETVMRPQITRIDLEQTVERLNQMESGSNKPWVTDSTELASAMKFVNARATPAVSRIEPLELIEAISAAFLESGGTTAGVACA